MRRRALLVACATPVAIFCFVILTILFIPNDTIRGVLVRAAENAGYTLECRNLGKAFPLGVKAEQVTLSSEKGELVKARDVRVALRILPLFIGKVRFGYRGMIGSGGEVEGDFSSGKAPSFALTAKGVRLEEIPFFSSVAGARVKGDFRANGSFQQKPNGLTGELQLQVQGADLAGLKIGETPLPDASYRDVRGALTVTGGRAVLKSFTLDGDGIYMRLKGDAALTQPLGNSQLNLTLEMMPKPPFLERQKFVFLLLIKYQTSPGAYSIPVRGTLGHPSI